MRNLGNFFGASARQYHHHLCPRQVLGVRIGAYAGELFGLDLPQSDSRVLLCKTVVCDCAKYSGWMKNRMGLTILRLSAPFVVSLRARSLRSV